MASTATKVGPKFQVTIPKPVREAVGLAVGDFIEATPAKGGSILLRPKILVDRVLERELEASVADVRAGRMSKSFTAARALVRDALRRGHELSKN